MPKKDTTLKQIGILLLIPLLCIITAACTAVWSPSRITAYAAEQLSEEEQTSEDASGTKEKIMPEENDTEKEAGSCLAEDDGGTKTEDTSEEEENETPELEEVKEEVVTTSEKEKEADREEPVAITEEETGEVEEPDSKDIEEETKPADKECAALMASEPVQEETDTDLPAEEDIEAEPEPDETSDTGEKADEDTPSVEDVPVKETEKAEEVEEKTQKENTQGGSEESDRQESEDEGDDTVPNSFFTEEVVAETVTPYTMPSHTNTEKETEVTVSQEKTGAALAKKTVRKKTVKKSPAARKKAKKKTKSKKQKKLHDMKLEAIAFRGKNMGDAQILSCGGKHLLIDTLGSDSWKLLRKWLKQHGYKKFDVYISHYHGDHYGNLLKLIRDKTFKISRLYLPDMKYMTGKSAYMQGYIKLCKKIVKTAKKKGIKITYLKKGSTFKVGDVRANVLWGTDYKSKRHYKKYINNNSLVTKFSSQNITYLNAGDIEKETEKQILRAGVNLHADVFKMSHHGVDTSNSNRFLRAVGASYYYYSYTMDNANRFSPQGTWSYRAVQDAQKYGNVTSLMYNGVAKGRTRMIIYRVKDGVVVQDIGKNVSKQKVYLYDKKKPRMLKKIMTLETNDASDFVLKSGMCPKYKGCKTIKKNTVRKKASIRKTTVKKKTSKKKTSKKVSKKKTAKKKSVWRQAAKKKAAKKNTPKKKAAKKKNSKKKKAAKKKAAKKKTPVKKKKTKKTAKKKASKRRKA